LDKRCREHSKGEGDEDLTWLFEREKKRIGASSDRKKGSKGDKSFLKEEAKKGTPVLKFRKGARERKKHTGGGRSISLFLLLLSY